MNKTINIKLVNTHIIKEKVPLPIEYIANEYNKLKIASTKNIIFLYVNFND